MTRDFKKALQKHLNMPRINYKVKSRQGNQYKPIKEVSNIVYKGELLRRLGLPNSRFIYYQTLDLIPHIKPKDYESLKNANKRIRYKYDIEAVKIRLKEIDRLQLQGKSMDYIVKQLK